MTGPVLRRALAKRLVCTVCCDPGASRDASRKGRPMKHMHRSIRIRQAAGPLALLLGLAGASPCCADSTLQAAAATGGPVSASAQLDFRITVAPTLALSPLGPGMRIQGNSGVLTLQRGAGADVQLHPRRGVIDASIAAAPLAAGNRVTIASP